jgi:hypothetical protein
MSDRALLFQCLTALNAIRNTGFRDVGGIRTSTYELAAKVSRHLDTEPDDGLSQEYDDTGEGSDRLRDPGEDAADRWNEDHPEDRTEESPGWYHDEDGAHQY